MLTPSVPAEATALNTVMAGTHRRMYGRIEFDWDRNGLYSHAYSDLTELWQSASGDRAMTTDLPDSVRTPDGYASGQLTTTLAGTMRSGVRTATLFDPYNRSSPIFGAQIIGTPVRYSRVVQTVIGDVVLPVFTGWVRAAPFKRTANEVSVTAADHLDLANASVTLPLWATPASVPDASWNWVTGPEARPFRSTWCLEEMLRQAGRPVGPQPRGDAVGFVTCSGAMFPSYGYGDVSDYQQIRYPHNFAHPLPSGPGDEGNWVVAPFGVAPNISATNLEDVASAQFSGNRQVFVTTDSSGAPDSRVGMGAYVFVRTTDDPTYPATTYLWLGNYNQSEEMFDPLYEQPSAVTEIMAMDVYSNGRVGLTIRESPAMAGFKTWAWDTTYALTDGWHYFNVIANFASGSVTATLTVDGGARVMTPTSSPAGGFRYRSPAPTLSYQNGGIPRDGKRNVVRVVTGGPPIHYAQIYAGDNTLAYSSQQTTKPLMANGKPFATVNPAGLDIFWIPDVYRQNPWEVMKNITNTFYAALYTDEYGSVTWSEHYKLRQDVGASGLTALSLTDEQLDELVTLPTDDSQRNSLIIPWTFVNGEEGTVWTQRNARDRSINVGGLQITGEPISGVIAASNRLVKISATPPATSSDEPDNRTGWFSAVQQADPSLDPPASDWGGGVQLSYDQRTLGSNWTGPSFGVPLFIGSYRDANQPSWHIAGAKYSQSRDGVEVVESAVSIAAVGRKTLTLGASDWMSIPDIARLIGNQLLDDLTIPAPTITPVRVPADPRRQLLDVLRVTNETGTGAFYGQIITKAWDDSADGSFMDILTLRQTSSPGLFTLDDNEFGVLDSTTPIG